MAKHLASDTGAHALSSPEIARILQEFQDRYGVTFTRDNFAKGEPTADGTFVLTPDNYDPLPPIGCRVKVNGYKGQAWNTIVTNVDEGSGTYTAQVVDTKPRACVKRSKFSDDHIEV